MSARSDAALTYGRADWDVLPANGKVALIKEWPERASSDPAQIEKWWRQYPDANIGLLCGRGRAVLDVDPRAGGDQSLAELVSQHEPLPDTAKVATGGGGWHLYFRISGAVASVTLAPGVELKAAARYVIAPPSIHPDTGREYTWIASEPVALLPAWLQQRDRTARAGAGTHEPPAERIPHGARHEYLRDIAVRLVRGGIVDERLLLALLRAAFDTDCDLDPPPEPGSLQKLAAWAADSEIADRERDERAQPAELRDELARLTHLADRDIAVRAVRMYGNGPTAAVELDLSNDETILTEHFGDLYTHTGLAKFVTQNTGIDAGAITKPEATRASALIRDLAHIASDTRTGDIGRDHGHDFLSRAPVTEFLLNDQASRYQAFAAVERCGRYVDPEQSLVLLDKTTGVRFAHCGHLFAHVRARGEVGAPAELARRMQLAGWSRKGKRGRIIATSSVTAHKIVLPFWLVPAGWEDT